MTIFTKLRQNHYLTISLESSRRDLSNGIGLISVRFLKKVVHAVLCSSGVHGTFFPEIPYIFVNIVTKFSKHPIVLHIFGKVSTSSIEWYKYHLRTVSVKKSSRTFVLMWRGTFSEIFNTFMNISTVWDERPIVLHIFGMGSSSSIEWYKYYLRAISVEKSSRTFVFMWRGTSESGGRGTPVLTQESALSPPPYPGSRPATTKMLTFSCVSSSNRDKTFEGLSH